MTEQKEFVDFNIGLGDSGEDNLSAIQPLSDGEGATQLQFRRPSENLRERTETLRDSVGELLYYRDYSHLMIEYTGGTITWNGPAPGASPLGKISITAGSFTIAPMLAPYQAKQGVLNVGTVSSNRLIYTVAPTAYATHGMNAVTVKHLNVTGTVTVAVTISAGPVKRIVVTFDSANSGHDAFVVQTALSAAIAGDTALAGRLVITTSALASVAILAVAETRLDTTADDEKHVVSGTDIQALTVTTPLQVGMGIAIWYKYLIEPTGFGADPKGGLAGGRAESSGDRGTSAIPSAALFVTHVSPEKIPGAIPLCRVGYNGQLIWYDGTRLESGESFQFKSPTSVAATALSAFTTALSQVTGGALVGYNGSGFWADGITAVTASTMENAVDEVVADLAAFTATSPGAIRVGVDSPTIFSGSLTALGGGGASTAASGTVRSALDQLDSAVVARRAFTAVISDGVASVGGDINNAALFVGLTAQLFGSGCYQLRRGAYTADAALPANLYGFTFIGEYLNLVTLTLTADCTFVSAPAIVDAAFEFENIYLQATGAGTQYSFGGATLRMQHCRAQAGILRISEVTLPTYVSIDALAIDVDAAISSDAESLQITNGNSVTAPIVGVVKNLQITKVPTVGGGAKTALRLNSLGDSAGVNTKALVFENCQIDPTGYLAAGTVLKMGTSYQPVVFRDTLFRSSNNSFNVTVAELTDVTDVLFENCKFMQDGLGKVLQVTGVSNNIRFRNCQFYTSPLGANYPEFGVICDEPGPTNPAKNIVFEDCYVEIRYGDHLGTSGQRRIEIGSQSGTVAGVGSFTIDGLHIVLAYVGFNATGGNTINNMSGYTVSISAGMPGNSTFEGRNITIDLDGKRLVGSGIPAIYLSGYQSASFEIDGFHIENLTEGNTAAVPTPAVTLSNSVVELSRGRINGGSINGTPAGSNVAAWKALFFLNGSGASVEGIRFYEVTAANKGRLILADERCKILGNNVYLSGLATGEDTPGWFCFCDKDGVIINDNAIVISGTAQGYLTATADHALIYLGANAKACSVLGNTIRLPAAVIKGITVEGDRNVIAGNTLACFSAVAETMFLLTAGAGANVVTANSLDNESSGTATVTDNGVVANFPNRVYGNTDDVAVIATTRILGPGSAKTTTEWTSTSNVATSTTSNGTMYFVLSDYLPDGAIVTKIQIYVDPVAAVFHPTASDRIQLQLKTHDVEGTIGTNLSYNDSTSIVPHYFSSGAISETIDKKTVNMTATVISSVSASGDLFYGLEVSYTTPKFYLD